MKSKNVLGIIHAHAYKAPVPELTASRTMASVPFGCRYRLIDFPLSNMVNAGISQVGIITNNNYQSLMDHIGSGKPWDLARKREGMFILPPYNSVSSTTGNHESCISSLYSISDFLRKARHEFVIMTNANMIYNLDFKDIFKFHTEKEADITVVYKYGRLPKIRDLMMFALDTNDQITEVSVAQPADVGREANYSFDILVMRKSLLEYLIRTAVAHNEDSFEKNVIQDNFRNLRVFGYEAKAFAEIIDSLKTYYTVSLSLLKPEINASLFTEKNPIYTKICDNVPVFYGSSACVKNTAAADGCRIYGSVENSLLFRDVVVEEGAVIKNSILMQGTFIGRNSEINHVITDKNVKITPYKTLSGDSAYPIHIGKNLSV